MLCLVVVGIDLVDLGMHFYNCGSLNAPVPFLIISLGIDVEFVWEFLEIHLVLDGHKALL